MASLYKTIEKISMNHEASGDYCKVTSKKQLVNKLFSKMNSSLSYMSAWVYLTSDVLHMKEDEKEILEMTYLFADKPIYCNQ